MTQVARILLDARTIEHPDARGRGMARYVSGLIEGLATEQIATTAFVADRVAARSLLRAHPALDIDVLGPGSLAQRIGDHTWYVATGLFLSPTSFDPVPHVVTESRLPVAGIIYDVIPFRHPARYQNDPAVASRLRLRSSLTRSLDAVLAISEFSATTAVEHLRLDRARVTTIGTGVSARFTRPDHARPRSGVVAVTGADERKNTRNLIEAWGRLPADLRRRHRLSVVADVPPSVLDRWRQWVIDAGCAESVEFAGAIDDDEMVRRLQTAALSVMPSIDEGFGLPVAEAAACGCPAICSAVSSLPEVIAEPAALFDPVDPAAIAAAIERGLTDEPHRTILTAAADRAATRWRWPAVVSALVSALEQIAPREATARPPRPRLALVGPDDVVPSGIGVYDVRVVAALRRSLGADAVVHAVDLVGRPGPLPVSAERVPASTFGVTVKASRFDDVVVVLGSSHFHADAMQIAVEHDAHVWLHEATLVGAVVGPAHLGGSFEWAVRHVERWLGPRDRARVRASHLADAPDGLLDADRLHRAGVRFLERVLERARSVIVSSEAAAAIVRESTDVEAPVLVLPLAYGTVRPAPPPSDADIVVAGWLAPSKQPLLAVEAVAVLNRSAEARLVFAGNAPGDLVTEVRAYAEELGVGDRVVITGHLERAEYEERIGSARVGLVLRSGDHGEMSGVIADFQSRGVPVVTTLPSAGPGGPGLNVLSPDSTATELCTALAPLLDDGEWRRQAAGAADRAASWSYDDVAGALRWWLREGAAASTGLTVVGPDRAGFD